MTKDEEREQQEQRHAAEKVRSLLVGTLRAQYEKTTGNVVREQADDGEVPYCPAYVHYLETIIATRAVADMDKKVIGTVIMRVDELSDIETACGEAGAPPRAVVEISVFEGRPLAFKVKHEETGDVLAVGEYK
jgi:hypothetical protein